MKNKYVTILALLLLSKTVQGQAWQCGFQNAQVDPATVQKILKLNDANKGPNQLQSERVVPVQLHIIRPSDGFGGVSADFVYHLLEFQVNPAYNYNGLNFHFFRCGDPHYIDEDVLYYNEWEPDALLDVLANYYSSGSNYRQTALNIYLANMIPSVGGVQWQPPNSDYSVIVINTNPNGNWVQPFWQEPAIYVHEIGHFFGLLHTHADNNSPVMEHVPRLGPCSNCNSSADYLCDTPADPNLGGSVQIYNCQYNGFDVDFCNNQYYPYQPDVTNYMSYAPPSCLSSFSPLQRILLQNTYDFYRKNAFEVSDCYCSPCYANVELPRTGADTTVVEPKIVRSKTGITSTELILAGAPGVGYKAAGYVCLNPGFEVKPGALFRALIDDCYLPTANKPGQERTLIPETQEPAGINLSVWPNPFSEVLQLRVRYGSAQPVRVRLMDAQGTLVWERNATPDSPAGEFVERIGAGKLNPGVYLLSVECGQERYIKKVTKLF